MKLLRFLNPFEGLPREKYNWKAVPQDVGFSELVVGQKVFNECGKEGTIISVGPNGCSFDSRGVIKSSDDLWIREDNFQQLLKIKCYVVIFSLLLGVCIGTALTFLATSSSG